MVTRRFWRLGRGGRGGVGGATDGGGRRWRRVVEQIGGAVTEDVVGTYWGGAV